MKVSELTLTSAIEKALEQSEAADGVVTLCRIPRLSENWRAAIDCAEALRPNSDVACIIDRGPNGTVNFVDLWDESYFRTKRTKNLSDDWRGCNFRLRILDTRRTDAMGALSDTVERLRALLDEPHSPDAENQLFGTIERLLNEVNEKLWSENVQVEVTRG